MQYSGCVGCVARPHSSSLQCPLMIIPSMYPTGRSTREVGSRVKREGQTREKGARVGVGERVEGEVGGAEVAVAGGGRGEGG